MRLSKIEASGVRGIPNGWPSLPIGERGLILYGPNGTGKTSLVDAIEFLITRRSTLFAENRAGVSWAIGRQHVQARRVGANLTVSNGATTWDIQFDKAPPLPIAAWCEAASSSSFLLRRYMLLRFIEAAPKGRYEQLEPFLNLKDFIELEERLSSTTSSIDTKRSVLKAQIASSTQAIRNSFDLSHTEPVTLVDILEKINAKLTVLGVTKCTDEASCEDASASVREILKSEKPSEKYLSLMRLRHAVQQLSTNRIYAELMAQLSSALQSVEEESGRERKLAVIELLESAKGVITDNELTECPVCERPIDPIAIADRLQVRIDENIRLTTFREDASRKRKAIQQLMKSSQTALADLISEWQRDLTEPMPDVYREESTLLTEIVESLGSFLTSETAASYARRLLETPENRDDLIILLDRLAISEEKGETRLVLSDANVMLTTFSAQWSEFSKKQAQLDRLDYQWSVADRIHGHAIDSRKDVVQELLDGISLIANDMYEFIHPAEKIAASKLAVRPTEDGSVNLHTEFYGKTAPPRLHLSESHLDTLGLCYFLALRKTEALADPSFRLLILDDVLHSVDADHRVRVAQLLKKEFSDHQLIITTHDEIFFGRLRAALGSNSVEYQKFHGWDIIRGPISGDKTSDIDLILDKSLHTAAGTATLAAACGRTFEWLLMQLTENLQVAVPARFSRPHDIGSMWPPLGKKLKSMKGFVAAHPNLCDDIDVHGWVRNAVGAHYNETASNATPSEVRDFALLLAQLYMATYCTTCDGFIAKSGDERWQCVEGCHSYAMRPNPVTTLRVVSAQA